MILTNVQLENAGKYKCKVSNLAGYDYIIYQLEVQSPPKIISDVPGTIDVVLNHMVEIPCKAQGIPDPIVTWEKDDFQVIHTLN